MKKTTQLKTMLHHPELDFLIEAHNGLSARIVEQSGFKGIWASGLALSVSMGVRDNNEVSWTQILDNAEFMSDSTSVPDTTGWRYGVWHLQQLSASGQEA